MTTRPSARATLFATALTLGMSLALAACGPSPDPQSDGGGGSDAGNDGGGSGPMTWARVQSEVLTSCTGSKCHAVGNANGMVEMDAVHAYANLVGQPSASVSSLNLIEAGAADASFWLMKLEGNQAQACTNAGSSVLNCGVRMPKGGQPLDAATLKGLRDWIDAGALQN